MRRIRFDIWLCLAIAFLASMGVEAIITSIRAPQYAAYEAEHTVNEGEIGGVALADTFRAQSIDDLLSHDTFTIISPGIEYRNRGGGYYGNQYLQAVKLPSGEIVAALIKNTNVTKVNPDDSIYTGDSILPVGTVIMEDLSSSPAFLNQIQYSEPLTRTDFYIDMMGNGRMESEESFTKGPAMVAQFLTIIIVFAILHFIGSKFGIFPAFFTKKSKEKPKSDWD